MYEKFRQMLASAKEGDSLFVAVADMDGLKYVNDTFGHAEGDFGIKAVSSTLVSVAKPGEICVRSGGDEFFLIGIGKYSEKEEAGRAIAFTEALSKTSEEAGKEYNISASIGCVIFEDCKQISLDNALSEADERMYRYKVKNRRHRMV
jgi:diguanylate cyclase (GGDEF)-like protein